VEPIGEVSLIRLTIGTGRTHQIRVHLSEAGYPVVGDRLYGGTRQKLSPTLSSLNHLDRPFLHACELSFAHPADGRVVTFSAPLPPELNRLVETLRRSTRRDGLVHPGNQI
jgi:23S rRNA pseudouridine1911/1915/1917 synthase